MVERFDRDLARRIYAGADLFLMPSRFEPCGQGQMIAMRYGTPPVARRTGGLADTIVDLHEEPGTGTGFLFDDATPDALRFACERAIAVLRDPRSDALGGPGPSRHGGRLGLGALVGARLRRDVPARGGRAAGRPGRPGSVAAHGGVVRRRRPAREPARQPGSTAATTTAPTVNADPSSAISNAARAASGASRSSRRTASARHGSGAVRESQSSVS